MQTGVLCKKIKQKPFSVHHRSLSCELWPLQSTSHLSCSRECPHCTSVRNLITLQMKPRSLWSIMGGGVNGCTLTFYLQDSCFSNDKSMVQGEVRAPPTALRGPNNTTVSVLVARKGERVLTGPKPVSRSSDRFGETLCSPLVSDRSTTHCSHFRAEIQCLCISMLNKAAISKRLYVMTF